MQLIGEKIRVLRMGKGLTQDELASALGYSKSFISHVENGTRSLTNADLPRFAKALGVLAEDLASEQSQAVVHFRVSGSSEGSQAKLARDFMEFVKRKNRDKT